MEAESVALIKSLCFTLDTLPYSIRVLFESSIRNCDGFLVKETDAMNILDWKTKQNYVEVPFCPARVVLQDFT